MMPWEMVSPVASAMALRLPRSARKAMPGVETPAAVGAGGRARAEVAQGWPPDRSADQRVSVEPLAGGSRTRESSGGGCADGSGEDV